MKNSIKIERTAHYYTQKPEKEITSITFVIHGYGQLAGDFLSEFSLLKSNGSLVIAPEAISKFYNKYKKPVANWMTSHCREDEIIDYINYLNLLFAKLNLEYGNLPIHVVGFSQGVSTLIRWINSEKIQPKSIHLIAGSIPTEVEKLHTIEDYTSYYYYGIEDKILTPEYALKQIQLLEKLGIKVSSVKFKGKHEVPSICIKNLLAFV